MISLFDCLILQLSASANVAWLWKCELYNAAAHLRVDTLGESCLYTMENKLITSANKWKYTRWV